VKRNRANSLHTQTIINDNAAKAHYVYVGNLPALLVVYPGRGTKIVGAGTASSGCCFFNTRRRSKQMKPGFCKPRGEALCQASFPNPESYSPGAPPGASLVRTLDTIPS